VILTSADVSSKRPDKKRPNSRGGKPGGKHPRAQANQPSGGPSSTVRVRQLEDGAWELVHPRCARDRAEDLEEVHKMVDAGELDVAMDECRWLLSGCSDCIEAHRILGEIALTENDFPLARGHFGYAYRLGEQTLAKAGNPSPVPYHLLTNRSFLESAKGLAFCLKQLGKEQMAREVVELTLRCDPSDPLGMRKLLDQQVKADRG
jgi:hypothetical protein